jgi:fructose-1,6-bisphosphatase
MAHTSPRAAFPLPLVEGIYSLKSTLIQQKGKIFMKDGFVFYQSFYDAITKLDEKDQLPLFKKVISFGLTGEIPENLSVIESVVLTLVEPTISANNAKYKKSVSNGKLDGHQKKEKNLKVFEVFNNENPKKNTKNLTVAEAVTEAEEETVTVTVTETVSQKTQNDENLENFLKEEKKEKKEKKSQNSANKGNLDPYTNPIRDFFNETVKEVYGQNKLLSASSCDPEPRSKPIPFPTPYRTGTG